LFDSVTSRLLVYFAVTALASVVGSTFTFLNNNWAGPGRIWWFPNPVGGVWIATFSLGPAMLIASRAKVSRVGTIAVASVGAVTMLAMWWIFASNDSSTSSLIFVWGWFIGIPAALILRQGFQPGDSASRGPQLRIGLFGYGGAIVLFATGGPALAALLVVVTYVWTTRVGQRQP